MTLAEMRAKLSELIARAETETGETQLATLDEAEKLHVELEAAQAQEARLQKLHNFNNTPDPDQGVRFPARSNPAPGTPANLSSYEGEIGRALLMDLQSEGLSDRQIEIVASEEYRVDFDRLLRLGHTRNFESRSLNEATIGDGAAIVPIQYLNEVIQRVSPRRRVADKVRRFKTSSKVLSIPKFLGGSPTQKNDLGWQWIGDTGSVTEDTTLENWGDVNIEMHEAGFVVTAKRDLVEDSSFNLAAWVMEQVVESRDALLDYIVLNGNGVKKPRGIIPRIGAAQQPILTSNIGTSIDAASLIGLVGDLEEVYAENASWIMRRATLYGSILSDKDTGGAFLFGTRSNEGGAVKRIDDMLLGYDVVQSDHMTAAGSAATSVLFGDYYKGYYLCERVVMTAEPYIDPAIQKAGKVGWYFRIRVGGDVALEHAMRGGTQS